MERSEVKRVYIFLKLLLWKGSPHNTPNLMYILVNHVIDRRSFIRCLPSIITVIIIIIITIIIIIIIFIITIMF